MQVRAEGVPLDVTEQELKAYFGAWGEVAQVEVVRRCAELVGLVGERSKVRRGCVGEGVLVVCCWLVCTMGVELWWWWRLGQLCL